MRLFKNISATIVILMIFFIAYLIYSLFFPEWLQTILTTIGLGYIAYILYQIIASKE